MGVTGRREAMGSVKNSLVSGEYRLEAKVHRGCLNDLNGMELGNNAKMFFLVAFPFGGS
jgi:hypothetical protein